MSLQASCALLFALSLAACAGGPLAEGVRSNDPAVVTAELDRGADINGPIGEAHLTPLGLAVSSGRPEMARLLLDRGADPNLKHRASSPLSIAILRGDAEMTRLLLSRGAEPSLKDVNWARGAGRTDIAAMLEAGAAKKQAPAASPAPAAADPDSPTYRVPEHHDDFALVVGIGKYMDSAEAPYAEADARLVLEHLACLGWPRRNIIALTGEGAGRAALDRYLDRWLPNNVSENSRFFFYFAGDGAADASGRPFLLPWDGDAAHLEATGYPLPLLHEKIKALKARASFIVIDAGFKGAPGERSVGGHSPALDAQGLGDIVEVLPAADGSWKAADAAEHGLLTRLLVQGLNKGEGSLRSLARSAQALLLTGAPGDYDIRLR